MARRCRERWINYLNPNLKKYFFQFIIEYYKIYFFRGSWSYEEDIKLLERFQQYNKKWSVISEVLKGRNLNSVKNRFHSLLKKNDISEPTSENINQLIVKLKNSDTSDSFIKDSSSELGKYDEDKEEVKLNEDPKKKLKLEEGQTEKNAKDFQNQFQIFNQFMVLANAFNDSKSNQQMPQQGYFPFNPFFAAAMMNKNPMDFPFLSPENIKSI